MTDQVPIRVRNYEPDIDKNFILNSWLKSYRNSPATRNMENGTYYFEQGRLIEEMLDKCSVLVACNTDDSTQIYGYLVSQEIKGTFIIHYVYTKLDFRNLGIAKMLIKARGHKLDRDNPAVYTHRTSSTDKHAYRFSLMHNPYMLTYWKDYIEEVIDYATIDS